MVAAYELSFAGLPFRIPPPDLRAKVEAHLRLGEVIDALNPNPLPEQWYGWLPDGPGSPAPRLYEYFYPWGARRFSIFRGLMARPEVNALPALVSPSASPSSTGGWQQQPTDFVMYAGPADGPVRTKLYLLPPRPLTGVDGATDLFLVTLVDERYFWRWRDVTIRSAPGDPAAGPVQLKWQHTWATVFDAIKAALGITLDYGTIDPNYGKPDPNSPLNQYRGPVAAALDFAAANTGRAVCRNFDGTYKAQKYPDATAAAELAHRAAVRQMGGELWTAAGAYDTTATEPLAPSLNRPSSVVVLSGHFDAKAARNRTFDPTGPTDDRTDFLDGELLDTFALTSYPAKGFTSGAAILREEGTNPPAAVVTQISRDWYDWNARPVDATYRGILAFDPLAGHDTLYAYDAPATRVFRGEFNLEFVRFSHWDGTQLVEYPRTATLQVVSVDSLGGPKCRIINPTDSAWPLDKEYGDVYLTTTGHVGGFPAAGADWMSFPPGESFAATFHGVIGGRAYFWAHGLLQSNQNAFATASVTPDGFPLYPGKMGGMISAGHQYLGAGTKWSGGLAFLPGLPASPVGWVDHGIVGFGLADPGPPPTPYTSGAPTGGVVVGGHAAAGTERQMFLPQAVVAGGVVLGRPDTPVANITTGGATSFNLYFDGRTARFFTPSVGGSAGTVHIGPAAWDTVGSAFNSYSTDPSGMAVGGWFAAGRYGTLRSDPNQVPFDPFGAGSAWIKGRSRWVPSFYGLPNPGGGDPHFGISIPPPDTYKGGMLFINGLYVGGDIPPPAAIQVGTNRVIGFFTRSY